MDVTDRWNRGLLSCAERPRIVLVRHNYSLDGKYDNRPTSVYWDGVGNSGH